MMHPFPPLPRLSLFTTSVALALVAPRPCFSADTPAPTSAKAPAHIGPRLTVGEELHDFGTIQRGEKLHVDFKVSNTGDDVLTISEVTPSCGCTTAGSWPHTLKPGESGTIAIAIDTSEFVGTVIKAVTIKSNDLARPELTLHMQANIWTPIELSNNVIVFPAAANPDEALSRSITLDNKVEEPLTLSDVGCDNPHFKAELLTLVPGKQFELKVTTVPPLPEGSQTTRIKLKSSNPKMPEVSVQAVVTVLPPVQIAPAQIALPAGKLSAPEKRFAFVLVHRGPAPELTDVTTDAPGVEITATHVANNKQVTLTVTFPAGFEIGANDRFVIRGKTNQPTASSFEIPIVAAASQ
jgi:hypothetical protein